MPVGRWLAMVRSRFWSNFARFSDEEMDRGVAEIAERLGLPAEGGGEEEVQFPDRILFIIGDKPL